MSDKPKSIGELNYRLKVLHDRYQRLDYELRDTNHILLVSAVERATNDKLEDVSWMWQHKSDVLSEEMKGIQQEIDGLIPSMQLINYMGEQFYFAYLEKYPINKDTKLVRGHFPYPSWNYPIPTEFDMFNPVDIQAMSPLNFKTGRADFERWSDGRYEYRLAFAPEINTVFAHEDAR